MIGFCHNHPPSDRVTWFCDATIPSERLSKLLGHEIHNRTPDGQLELIKKAVQIPRDSDGGAVTVEASRNRVRCGTLVITGKD